MILPISTSFSRYFSTDEMPEESALDITSKINSRCDLFNFFAATKERIAAYAKSTSSLNPPLDLNPSIILESILMLSVI